MQLDFYSNFPLRLRAPAPVQVHMIPPQKHRTLSKRSLCQGARSKFLLSQTSWPLFFVLLWASHMTLPNKVLHYKPAVIASNDLTAKEL